MGTHPISYTELFPKLVRIGHIEPVQLAPLRPPFPRWYNAHTRCNYHGRNSSHPTENYNALKYRVQELINDGKLTFEDLDGPVEIKDPSRAKLEIARQDHGVPREASPEKAAIPRDEVPTAKVRKDEASGSLTTEGSEERLCESNEEEENKMLRRLIQKLGQILNEQKEFSIALREENR